MGSKPHSSHRMDPNGSHPLPPPSPLPLAHTDHTPADLSAGRRRRSGHRSLALDPRPRQPLVKLQHPLVPRSYRRWLTNPLLGTPSDQAEDRSFRFQLGDVHDLGGKAVYVYSYRHPVAAHLYYDVAIAPAYHLLRASRLA